MKYTAEQKLKILTKLPAGERHAVEVLWGLGSDFWVYLFQCFRALQKEGLGMEYDKLKAAFPAEEQAYRDYIIGKMSSRLSGLLEEEKPNGNG